jgi:CheY-like chemotaxis protein
MFRRILVVEDEAMVAMLIEDILMDLGCTLTALATTTAEALIVAASQDFDLALLDVNLGDGETSFPVAELLRHKGTQFAFLTGYGVGGVRADFRDAPVLGKPVDPVELARLLNS